MKGAFPLPLLLLLSACLNPARFSEPSWDDFPEAGPEDSSRPDHVIGTGTPESCTAQALREAVAQGGVITFNGGTEPFTIVLDSQAEVHNDGLPDVVIDGGGLVTLSGGGTTRILYMNTCDPDLTWTTDHCQDQDHPRLTVQNLTFADGNSTGDSTYTGGGAIWARGGRIKAVNCTFVNNRALEVGPDTGGGAIRVFSQYQGKPVYITDCLFGGAEGRGNSASNGGALSSIGVSWTIIGSRFFGNQALGNGGNPAQSGTPGGGSGGAIYNDGDRMTLTIVDSEIGDNRVNAYGSAVFFVSNDHTGNIVIRGSRITGNHGGSWYPAYEGISMHSDTPISVTDSVIGDNRD